MKEELQDLINEFDGNEETVQELSCGKGEDE